MTTELQAKMIVAIAEDEYTPVNGARPMHAKWEVVGLLERNATMVENWLAEAVPMAEGLYRLWRAAGSDMEALPNLQMEGQFTGECRWCDFLGLCTH